MALLHLCVHEVCICAASPQEFAWSSIYCNHASVFQCGLTFSCNFGFLSVQGGSKSREHCMIDSKTLRVCQVEVVRAVNAGKQGAPRLCQIWHLEQDISHLFYFMYRSFLLWARNLVDSRGRVFLGHASVSCLKARPQLWKRFACKFLFSSPDGWGIHRPFSKKHFQTVFVNCCSPIYSYGCSQWVIVNWQPWPLIPLLELSRWRDTPRMEKWDHVLLG